MSNNCIDHTGPLTATGYARLYDPVKQKTVRGNRKVYEDHYGPIPTGMVVMHICDNRKCINIEHLRLGTQSENIKDMHDKKRHNVKMPSGTSHHMTTLSEEQIKEIRNRYPQESSRTLAKEYGVTHPTILNIARHKTWSNI